MAEIAASKSAQSIFASRLTGVSKVDSLAVWYKSVNFVVQRHVPPPPPPPHPLSVAHLFISLSHSSPPPPSLLNHTLRFLILGSDGGGTSQPVWLGKWPRLPTRSLSCPSSAPRPRLQVHAIRLEYRGGGGQGGWGGGGLIVKKFTITAARTHPDTVFKYPGLLKGV